MFDGRQPAAIKCKHSSSLRSRSVRAGVGRRWRVDSQRSVGSDSDLELELVQRGKRFDGCQSRASSPRSAGLLVPPRSLRWALHPQGQPLFSLHRARHCAFSVGPVLRGSAPPGSARVSPSTASARHPIRRRENISMHWGLENVKTQFPKLSAYKPPN